MTRVRQPISIRKPPHFFLIGADSPFAAVLNRNRKLVGIGQSWYRGHCRVAFMDPPVPPRQSTGVRLKDGVVAVIVVTVDSSQNLIPASLKSKPCSLCYCANIVNKRSSPQQCFAHKMPIEPAVLLRYIRASRKTEPDAISATKRICP
jgi:hypothetical protein